MQMQIQKNKLKKVSSLLLFNILLVDHLVAFAQTGEFQLVGGFFFKFQKIVHLIYDMVLFIMKYSSWSKTKKY